MQRAGAQRGELVARVLLSSGAPIGWYVYYLGRDRMAQVVQIAAAERHVAALLDHLAADADRRGAIAIEGRLEAGLVEPLSDRHAWIAYREPLALIHSRSPEITAAIHAGQSFLTRADGEWPAVFNL